MKATKEVPTCKIFPLVNNVHSDWLQDSMLVDVAWKAIKAKCAGNSINDKQKALSGLISQDCTGDMNKAFKVHDLIKRDMIIAFGDKIDTSILVDFMFTIRLADRYHVHRVLAWNATAFKFEDL